MQTKNFSYGLHAFTEGFSIASHTSVLGCLAPAVLRSSSGAFYRATFSRQDGIRRSSNDVAGVRATTPKLPAAISSNKTQHDRISSTFTPSSLLPIEKSYDSDQAALVDPYLPLELRSKDWLENLAYFEGVRSIHTLPELLSEVQNEGPFKPGLLSYIGLHQGRWPALLWLIKAMLAASQSFFPPSGDKPLYQTPPDTSMSLDELTSIRDPPYEITSKTQPQPTTFALNDFTGPDDVSWQRNSDGPDQDVIGQIWRCVGYLIIEAADRKPEETTKIMSYVHQILAHMHHYDAIPNSLYNYKLAKDPSSLRRPPTLHLLTSRILTILSDSVWKAHEQAIIAEAAQVGAKYVYKGHELPGAEYTPRIRKLNLATWLELVLWSCIEGGRIAIAAWIVHQVSVRQDESRWNAINWEELHNSAIKAGSDASLSDWQNYYKRSAGTREGYNDVPPFIEMRSRTVSTEVIEVLTDALTCTMRSSVESRINIPIQRALIYIDDCKALLSGKRDRNSEKSLWNQIMLRMVESGNFEAESEPGILEAVLDIAAPHQGGSQSAAVLGIYYSILESYIRLASVDSAINIFRKLQSLIDTHRAKGLGRIRIPQKIKKDPQDPSANEAQGSRASGWKVQEMPEPLLADFLDLLTREKRYDLGHKLLFPETNVEPIIPLKLYSSSDLQPALLRFAQATANTSLLIDVTKQLASPLSLNVMRALLHCQIILEKWDAVEDLLEYIRTVKESGVSAEDVMMIARALLSSQPQNILNERGEHGIRAHKILRNMLRGAYDANPDLSRPRNYSQRRLINQIGRILASVPGNTATIATEFVQAKGPAHGTTDVPIQAFNLFLEGVVETHGSLAGKRLWDIWCRRPAPSEETAQIDGIPFETNIHPQGQEKVVAPTTQTLRIILAPLTGSKLKFPTARKTLVDRMSSLKEGSQEWIEAESNLELLDWGMQMYQLLEVRAESHKN